MAEISETPAGQNVNAEQPAGTKQPGSTEQPEGVQEAQAVKEVSKDARMWAMFCHLGGLAGLLPIVPAIGSIIAPLIIWQIKKDEFPFVNEQGKEAVNFQISMLIYALIAGALICVGIGIFLLPVVGVFDLVFLLIAAVKANNGEHYRYPLTIRFIK